MKTLADGKNVRARTYYYLLDWNKSNNKKYIAERFGKQKLYDLTLSEYKQLFNHATVSDLNLIVEEKEKKKCMICGCILPDNFLVNTCYGCDS
jgi:hypothetical protein